VMGNDESAVSESFEGGLLEAPHFTRPAEYEGHEVPEVLRSGDHARIARWRHAQALHRTMALRPDLISRRGGLNDVEKRLLEEFPSLPYPEGSL
jgi:tRNA (guanine37-N1)-methyltransferase